VAGGLLLSDRGLPASAAPGGSRGWSDSLRWAQRSTRLRIPPQIAAAPVPGLKQCGLAPRWCTTVLKEAIRGRACVFPSRHGACFRA